MEIATSDKGGSPTCPSTMRRVSGMQDASPKQPFSSGPTSQMLDGREADKVNLDGDYTNVGI